MCRRYTLNAAALPAGLQRLWPGFAQQLTLDGFPAAEESIVPGSLAPVITAQGTGWRITRMQWGFPSIRPGRGPVTHARSETVEERPLFAESFARRRCLIPAGSFAERGRCLHAPEGSPAVLYMAGLYDTFWDTEGRPYQAFVVLTRASAGLLRAIHPRMPLLIPEALQDAYLSSAGSARRLLEQTPPPLMCEEAIGHFPP